MYWINFQLMLNTAYKVLTVCTGH